MTWPARVFTEPVTILVPHRENDDYGPAAADWDEATPVNTLARLQPASSAESLVNVDEQETDMVAYLPAGTDITGRDRVATADGTFEVIGPPLRWRSPWTTLEHHVKVTLRRIDRAGTDASGERHGEWAVP